MRKNILDYLEFNANLYPEKIIYTDECESITYSAFVKRCKEFATGLPREVYKNTVGIMLKRSLSQTIAMIGCIYAGAIYTVLDDLAPIERSKKILEVLDSKYLIYDDTVKNKINTLDISNKEINKIEYNETFKEIDEEYLKKVRKNQVSTDPMYILFTSGSTGTPKGAVLSHLNVISYLSWFKEEFDIDEKTIFANQTPLYFSMSISDVLGTLFSGSTLHIIPKVYFSFPIKLIEFMNSREVNTIYWVPSAYQIVSSIDLFKYAIPTYLTKCLFAGEVMQIKYLNYWRSYLKNALFANLFGPTETVDICTYYKVDREFNNDESLPIGYPCNNTQVFLLNDKLEEASVNEDGELYVRGSTVGLGYYNNPLKTKEAFVLNPLNKAYPEYVYKTGDICKINEKGELIYISRADFQFKHLGYRIETGEIEAAIINNSNVNACACIYDEKIDEIICLYEGREKQDALLEIVRNKLPYYMIPKKIIKLKQMVYNQNGKIDRKWLKANYNTFEGR